MKLMVRMLRQHTVLEAATAEEALQLFTDRYSRIDCLIAGVKLPRSSGIQVAILLRSRIRRLPVILTSGYPANSWSSRDSADLERLGTNSVTMLQKPFQAQILRDAVRELIGEPLTEKARTA